MSGSEPRNGNIIIPTTSLSYSGVHNIFDDRMYVGRIQFNLNDGKKRRFLYFQADYEPKYQARGAGE